MTGFDIPHTFPEDYIPVFGMDVPTCVAFYSKRHNLCALPLAAQLGAWSKLRLTSAA